jgi:hypothetical protein
MQQTTQPTNLILFQQPDENDRIHSALNNVNLKPNKKYACFTEAQKFAKSLSLKTRKEWRTYINGQMPNKPQKPAEVPAHPDGIYKVKGWQGWKIWLGTAEGKLEKH